MSEIDTVSTDTVVDQAPAAEAPAAEAPAAEAPAAEAPAAETKPSKQESLVQAYEKAKFAYYDSKNKYEAEMAEVMAELSDKYSLLMRESQYLAAKKAAFQIIAKSPDHVSAVSSAKADAKEARKTLEAVTAENAAAKRRLNEMRDAFATLTEQYKTDPANADLKSQVEASKKALDAEEVSRKGVRSRLKLAKQDADAKAKAAANLRKG
jgi:hypothetical protein